MGFEYIYAYHENLKYGFLACMIFGALWLLVGIILRVSNEMDKDDWFLFMGMAFLWFLFFFILTLSPSMEHIQRVRAELSATQSIPRESQDEKPVCYFNSVVANRVCGE